MQIEDTDKLKYELLQLGCTSVEAMIEQADLLVTNEYDANEIMSTLVDDMYEASQESGDFTIPEEMSALSDWIEGFLDTNR